MDTKTYHTLDPKLKATYDRIMGTAAGAKASHAPTGAKSTPQSEKKTIANPHYVASAASSNTHETTPAHHTGHLSHLSYSASDKKPEHLEKPKTEHNSDSLVFPIIMGAGGVIFFVFYAIFWMSFFGM